MNHKSRLMGMSTSMNLKQRLTAFFTCIDCHGFTLTGWSCWKCDRRLCFGCAGGWARYYGWSPGFGTCESCKSEYTKAYEREFPLNKKRRTFRTPLNPTEYSRRLFMQEPIYLAFSELKPWPSLQKIRRFYRGDLTACYEAVQRFSANLQFCRCLLRAQYFIFHFLCLLFACGQGIRVSIFHCTQYTDI